MYNSSSPVPRRTFLRWAAGSAFAPAALAAPPYPVGVGHSSVPYDATRQAIDACGEFPVRKITNRTVILKVNLVTAMPSNTGTTTDPEVTRAVVDMCLQAGADRVLIVEGSATGNANFSACGYDFFTSYDPQGRIQLIDLLQQTPTLSPVPHRYNFSQLYSAEAVLDPTALFFSIAKLKTHDKARASLSCKNLIGIASPVEYHAPGSPRRDDLHSRGLDYAIADLNMARPTHFAVIDGVIGMEGDGPTQGTPIETDLVLAGRNSVAVDRVGIDVMGFSVGYIPQYLTYLANRGVGPASLADVQVRGYSYSRLNFRKPVSCPGAIWLAPPKPSQFSAGQTVTLGYQIQVSSDIQVEVATDSDTQPGMAQVTVLQPRQTLPPGSHQIQWDGRDAQGAYVAPGSYLLRVICWLPAGDLWTSPTAWVTYLG